MTRVNQLCAALLLLGAGFSTPMPGQRAVVSAAKTAASDAKIEPDAIMALQKMSAYLRTLKDFQVRATATSEAVLTDGQKVEISQNTNLLARVPDRMLAEVEGDRGSKVYLFNGKTFTLLARNEGYYATVPAPPTLLQLADELEDRYDIELPLVDLFLWGSANTPAPVFTSAIDVGRGQVEGVTCEHYAFRQEGLDWQVWIQKGEYPLPRKLVLTTMTDAARPQYTSVLHWNLAPSYNETAFNFSPPSGTHKIVLAKTPAKRSQ